MLTSERKHEIETGVKAIAESLIQICNEMKCTISIDSHYYNGSDDAMSLIFFHNQNEECDFSTSPGIDRLFEKLHLAEGLTPERESEIKSVLKTHTESLDKIAIELRTSTSIQASYNPEYNSAFSFVGVLRDTWPIHIHGIDKIDNMLQFFERPAKIEVEDEDD